MDILPPEPLFQLSFADDTRAGYHLPQSPPASAGGLLRHYEASLQFSREKYRELESSFTALREKYEALLEQSEENARDNGNGEDVNTLHRLLKKYELKITQLQQALELMERERTDGQAAAPDGEWMAQKEAELAQWRTMAGQLEESIGSLRQEKQDQLVEMERLSVLVQELEAAALAAAGETAAVRQTWEERLGEADQRLSSEKDEWASELQAIKESFEHLQQENASLKEQIEASLAGKNEAAPNDDLQLQELLQQIHQLGEERKSLHEKLREQECLPDLLKEKKLQIDFLQNQLDQRIRSYHQLEHEFNEGRVALQDAQDGLQGYVEEIASLRTTLQARESEMDQWRSAIAEKEEEQARWQEQAQSQAAEISRLEQVVDELNRQNESLRITLLDSRQEGDRLREDLRRGEEQVQELASLSAGHKQLLTNIYKALSQSLNSERILPAPQEMAGVEVESQTFVEGL